MKTLSIEKLAELINGKLWVKGDLKRIYIEEGYNTKKMTTKTYVYEKDARFIVVCKIDCPSQDINWIVSQQDKIVNDCNDFIARMIEEHGVEIADPIIAKNEALATEEQVQGYYMRWHEVRVAINGFGKLATRKRMQVHTYQGAISQTPAGFTALNDDDFQIALKKEANETKYEFGCEPQFAGMAEKERAADAHRLAQQIANEERSRQQAEEKAAAIAAGTAVLNQMLESGTSLPEVMKAWKAAGAQHPAPAAITEAKKASGLGWGPFTDSIKL
jgi:hypothetical protein